nr:STAS domain-containing protein [Amycolatopsis umgeniensis]
MVIALTGDLDSTSVPVLASAAALVLERVPRPGVIVIDLDAVTFLTVAGIHALHHATDTAAAAGVTVRIARGRDRVVDRALTATGADAVLDSYPDRLAALAAGIRGEFDNLIRHS